MTRTCPDCRYPMVTERYHDFDLDLCRNCAGIWFDAGELHRLITSDPVAVIALEEKVMPRVRQERKEASVFICPGCNGLLHVYHYQYDSPIELNACLDCGGFWVQEGELEKIYQWRNEHAPSEPKNTHASAHSGTEVERRSATDRPEGIRRLYGLLRQHQPTWLGGHR